MNLKTISCLLCLMFILCGACLTEENPPASQLPQTDARISMDFRDASIKDILKIFSQQSGITFIPNDDVQDKKVTLYLENVSVKDAINSIVQANGLTYEQGPEKSIFIVRPSGEGKIKTVTKVYTLSFIYVVPITTGEGSTSTSANILDIVTKLLTSTGNIIVDQRTNSLVITDIPEQFELIEEVIAKLDTPTPQVFIEAEIVETTVDVATRLGLEYGGSTGTWGATYDGPVKGYSFPYATKSFKDHGASPTFTFGTLTFGDVSVVLKALSSHADTKYLARPKLLTLNNETASIEITSDTFVGTVTTEQATTGTTSTSAERMPTGVSLKVTPQVNAEDYVTMVLEPSISRTEVSAVNVGFLNPIKRSAKAKVMVKNGQTVFIGGLLDTQKNDTKRKVPVLGDIPIAGALFKSDTVTDKQTEILIFITPHIIQSKVEEGPKAVSEKQGPQDVEREQIISETIQELKKKKE